MNQFQIVFGITAVIVLGLETAAFKAVEKGVEKGWISTSRFTGGN